MSVGTIFSNSLDSRIIIFVCLFCLGACAYGAPCEVIDTCIQDAADHQYCILDQSSRSNLVNILPSNYLYVEDLDLDVFVEAAKHLQDPRPLFLAFILLNIEMI